MNDTPTSDELLDAVARTLTEQVLPDTSGSTRHSVRVAASLCRLVARELASPDEGEVDLALAELLGVDAGDDLARVLDERLRADDPEFESRVADLLYTDVCQRVDIAKPGYREPTW